MKLAAATVVASLAWTGCSTAGPASPVPIETGKAFSLKTGESAQTRDGSLRVGFDDVTADSRCPKGVQCVWAGDATVRVWLQHGSGPRETRELHTSPSAAQSARVLDHDLALVRLDPYPVNGRPTVKADYVATLTLGRGPAAAPER